MENDLSERLTIDVRRSSVGQKGGGSSRNSMSSISPIMSHQIPHQIQKQTLISPASCSACNKFIWGIGKESYICLECNLQWHPGCREHAGNDCGISSKMKTSIQELNYEMIQGISPGKSPRMEAKKYSIDSEKIKICNGHQFKLYNYLSPTWCGVCGDFIWGLTKQGWKCLKCQLDSHTRCTEKVTTECLTFTGGQLKVVDKNNKNEKSNNKVSDRRISDHKTHTTFNKRSGFRLHKKNGLVAGLVRQSMIIAPVQAEKEEEEGSESPERKTSSEDALPQGLPLTNDLQFVQDLEKESSTFAESFETGIMARERRESVTDTTHSDKLASDDIKEYQLEDFEIYNEKVLGSGQFGTVKYAENKATKVKLAVKVINKKKFWGKKSSQRHLRREIAILSSIRHPHIIQLHAVIDCPMDLYLFMEYVEGGDLLSYVESKGHLDEDEAKFLFHQLCVGVKYLHDSAIIHRDLKPENLLLSEEDGVKRVKIADFGFANIIGDKNFLQSVVGTPAYVAPEILRKNNQGYEKSADIWSIGVILYACLSGVFPFDDEEPVEDQIKAGKFTFPDRYWKHVSDDAIDLICDLLKVDTKKRATIDGVLKHHWFTTNKQLKL